MNIDWSKAPDWAVAHGLHETGFGIKEFWLGETQNQNLEHAKSFPYGGGDPASGSFHNSRRESFSFVTERPVPWTGEHFPPVGTVCEMTTNDGHNWRVVKIIFFDDCVTMIGEADGKVNRELFKRCDADVAFRPIRTPEQIAADQYEQDAKEIAKILSDLDGADNTFVAKTLLDCGYRRFEIVDA